MERPPTGGSPPDALRSLISRLGLTQAAFSRAIGIKPQQLQEWLTRRRPVPPARAVAIEQIAAGAVRADDLCPGFDFIRDAAGAAIGYRVRTAPPAGESRAA